MSSSPTPPSPFTLIFKTLRSTLTLTAGGRYDPHDASPLGRPNQDAATERGIEGEEARSGSGGMDSAIYETVAVSGADYEHEVSTDPKGIGFALGSLYPGTLHAHGQVCVTPHPYSHLAPFPQALPSITPLISQSPSATSSPRPLASHAPHFHPSRSYARPLPGDQGA